jgi:hypothetical protein
MNIETLKAAISLIEQMGGAATQPETAHRDAIPVVVWTDRRGVIFGYTTNPDARPISLTNARMCLYWPSSVGGVFGLCDIGPNAESKISATLPSATFEGVTGVAAVTPAAEAAWISAKVQGR